MRTTAWISASLLLALLAAGGCDSAQEPVGIPDPEPLSRSADLAPASAPTAIPIFTEFEDVNPCSGLIHTVTFTGTAWIHEHDGQVVVHAQRTVSTSSGFEGRGTDTFVGNGNILKHTGNDMLTHESGDRIRARFVFVFDLATSTVQVLKGEVTCVGGIGNPSVG